MQTVVITGGGTGIGRELALAFGRAGHRVVICGRRQAPLEQVAAELRELGTEVLAQSVDVSDKAAVCQFAAAVKEQFGGCDILVNNAAQFAGGPVVDMPAADFERVLVTNLVGPFLVSQAFLPGMIERQQGTIVMIGSTSGRRGDPGGSAYSASKFGLVGFSQSLFQEVRQDNVRVIMVYPSAVDTSVRDDKPTSGKGARLCAEDIAEAVLASTQLPARAVVRELELWATNP